MLIHAEDLRWENQAFSSLLLSCFLETLVSVPLFGQAAFGLSQQSVRFVVN